MSLDHWDILPSLCGRFVMLRPTVMADLQGLALAHDDSDTLKYFPYGIESEPPSAESLENALRSGRQVLTQIDIYRGRIIGTTLLAILRVFSSGQSIIGVVRSTSSGQHPCGSAILRQLPGNNPPLPGCNEQKAAPSFCPKMAAPGERAGDPPSDPRLRTIRLSVQERHPDQSMWFWKRFFSLSLAFLIEIM